VTDLSRRMKRAERLNEPTASEGEHIQQKCPIVKPGLLKMNLMPGPLQTQRFTEVTFSRLPRQDHVFSPICPATWSAHKTEVPASKTQPKEWTLLQGSRISQETRPKILERP